MKSKDSKDDKKETKLAQSKWDFTRLGQGAKSWGGGGTSFQRAVLLQRKGISGVLFN